MSDVSLDFFTYALDQNIGPILILMGLVICLLLGRIIGSTPFALHALCMVGLIGAFALIIMSSSEIQASIQGLSFGPIYRLGLMLVVVALLAIHLMIMLEDIEPHRKVDCAALLYVSALGGVISLASTNWMMLFIGIQCLSLPIFGMLALNTDMRSSVHSATRYLLLSSIAVACMLFGSAILYAQTGTLDFALQSQLVTTLDPGSYGLATFGFALVMIGLLFKLSLAPFHVWAPSVYQGARGFSLAYLITIAKSVILLFVVHNAWIFFGLNSTALLASLYAVATLSMWLGNGLMIQEQNYARFISYLSIGHMGFLLVPYISQHPFGTSAIIIDLLAFAFALILQLMTLQRLFPSLHHLSLQDLKGLYNKNPYAAFVLAVSCASLAGVPLTAGFIAKYTIILSGALSDQWFLLMNMILSSAISLWALLKVVVMLYSPSPTTQRAAGYSLGTGLLVLGACALFIFGISPDAWLNFIQAHIAQY